MGDVLKIEEAALLLRLSAAGLRRLILQGRVKAVKVGKRWLVSRAEVDRILEEGTRPAVVPLAGGRELKREQIEAAVDRSGSARDPGPEHPPMEAAARGPARALYASGAGELRAARVIG